MTCNFYLFKAILDHDFITVSILLFISLSVIDCFRLTCTFSANASRQRKIKKKVDLVFFEIGDFEYNTMASHLMLDACGKIRPYFNLRTSTKIIFLQQMYSMLIL